MKEMMEVQAETAKVLDAALAERGRAALIRPTGCGKAELAFAWAEAHPGTAVLWLTPGEEQRAMRAAQAARRGRPLGENLRLLSAAGLGSAPAREWVELARLRPGCIVLDGYRSFSALAFARTVQPLLRYCPQAAVLGLAAPEDPAGCCAAEDLFREAVVSECTLAQALAQGLCPRPGTVTPLLWPAAAALEELQAQRKNLHTPGQPDPLERNEAVLSRTIEHCGAVLTLLAQALPRGRWFVLCEDDAALSRAEPLWDRADVQLARSGPDVGLRQEGFVGAVLVRSSADPGGYRQMLARALSVCGSVPVAELNASFAGLAEDAALRTEVEAAGGTLWALAEPFRPAYRQASQLRHGLDARWNQYLAAAKAMAQGRPLEELPRSAVSESGLAVGRWLEVQRQVRAGKRPGRLTAEQAAKLEKLGLCWKQRLEQTWERGFASARRYRTAHGDLMVPVRFRDKNGFPLGEWIVYNRQRYLCGSLPPDRVERLQALGMVWDTTAALWEENYAAALQYAVEHHGLEVPVKYVTPAGVALGVWLGSQRAAYKEGTLSKGQIAQLDALGMDWSNRNDRKWQQTYEAAVRYYRAHGDLNVPSEYVDADGILLGKWVSRQRYAWQNPDRSSARVTPERKALLDELGMVWEKPDSWQHRYELAAAYKARHGSLEMPAQYHTEDGIWLGTWLSRQRQLLRQEEHKLSPARRKALRELFRGESGRRAVPAQRSRSTVREQNWLANYRRAKAYAKRRGDLLVPASFVDETGCRLGVWISNLRAARKTRPDSFQVTPEHIALLDAIGMQWDAREAKWQAALRRAEEYRAAHGDLLVPINYKTGDGFCLGDWLRRMRESYAAHDAKLTPERVRALDAMGMVWALPVQR